MGRSQPAETSQQSMSQALMVVVIAQFYRPAAWGWGARSLGATAVAGPSSRATHRLVMAAPILWELDECGEEERRESGPSGKV